MSWAGRNSAYGAARRRSSGIDPYMLPGRPPGGRPSVVSQRYPSESKDRESEKPIDEEFAVGEQQSLEGDEKFHQLGWKKLTVCLIVEAIALGSLSIPSAFASVGMVAGVLLTVGLGMVAQVYTQL